MNYVNFSPSREVDLCNYSHSEHHLISQGFDPLFKKLNQMTPVMMVMLEPGLECCETYFIQTCFFCHDSNWFCVQHFLQWAFYFNGLWWFMAKDLFTLKENRWMWWLFEVLIKLINIHVNRARCSCLSNCFHKCCVCNSL